MAVHAVRLVQWLSLVVNNESVLCPAPFFLFFYPTSRIMAMEFKVGTPRSQAENMDVPALDTQMSVQNLSDNQKDKMDVPDTSGEVSYLCQTTLQAYLRQIKHHPRCGTP